MEIQYFAKWFAAKRHGIGPLTASAASSRHSRGESYVAELRDAARTHFVVDIALPWVSALFVDTAGRTYLKYDFRLHEQDNLVLKGATHREFKGTTDEIADVCMFNFQPDGSYIATGMNEHGQTEVEGAGDPSPLFAKFPKFGHYEELCVPERAGPNAA